MQEKWLILISLLHDGARMVKKKASTIQQGKKKAKDTSLHKGKDTGKRQGKESPRKNVDSSEIVCCALWRQHKRVLLWSAAGVVIAILLFAIFLNFGSSRTVAVGDVVSVRYIGSTDVGVFDTNIASVATKHNLDSSLDLLTFTVGGGQVIQGFDEAVIGMREGEKKTVTIPPHKAYGVQRSDLVQSLSLQEFQDAFPNVEPVEGESFVAVTESGRAVTLRFKQVGFDFVTLDMNHKLAGKELTFEIRLASIS